MPAPPDIGGNGGTSPRPRRPLLAVALLLPIPSLGGAASMWWWPDTAWGKGLYTLSKFALLAFPLLWHRHVDGGEFHLPRPRLSDLKSGVPTGLFFLLAVPVAYMWVGGDLLNTAEIAGHLRAVGLGSPLVFAAMAVYWCTANAVLEEMVWRWFFLRQIQSFIPGRTLAIFLASAGFALHHWVVVRAWLPPVSTTVATMAVGIAGAIWCGLTLKTARILPACFSHILADVGIVVVGAWILFA